MRHSAIDLSAYLPPDAIEPLDYERALEDRKAAFMRSFDARNPTPAERADMVRMLDFEYEPIVALLEQDAYLDVIETARINDKVRAVLLATAYDTTLDHIAATYYRTARRVITPADPAAGVDAVLEDDETFRQRTALSPESWSCAGPDGAYTYFAISASGDVLDVAVYSEDEGACLAPWVRVVALGQGGVAPTASTLAVVEAALTAEAIRPCGDRVSVEAATPLPYEIAVTLMLRPGASAEIARQAAAARIAAYASGRLRWAGEGVSGPVWLIGRRIRTGTIAAAARVDGVEEVIVTAPAADVNPPPAGYDQALPIAMTATSALDPALTAHLFRAPICMSVTVTTQVVSQGWSS